MSRDDPESTRSAKQGGGDAAPGGGGSDAGRDGGGARTKAAVPSTPKAGAKAKASPKAKAKGGPARPSTARRVETFFAKDLWSRELASLPTFRRIVYGFARVAQLTVTNFVKDRCSWRASALTYITVLSLVPLLALAFSVAKGMGAYETLRTRTIDPFLESTFGGEVAVADPGASDGDAATEGDPGDGDQGSAADGGRDAEAGSEASGDGGGAAPGTGEPPGSAAAEGAVDATASDGSQDPGPAGDDPGTEAEPETTEELGEELGEVLSNDDGAAGAAAQDTEGGAQVREALEMVLEFVENTNVSSLGALGFLLVIFTVIKLLGAIEVSFNDIWGVFRARSLPRKIADYFSTVVLVPVLLVTGTGLLRVARSERFESVVGLGGDDNLLAEFGSFAVVWLAFAFAYILMPNTRIRITSALVGGVVGGTMWQLFQWAHVELQVGVANYNAIYSTFAALPIFLFWVQSSWMTVLLGAEAAAAHQNQARHGQLVRSRDYDLAQKEVVALRLMTRLTRGFLAGRGSRPSSQLADDLGCPDRVLEEVAVGLEQAGLVATVERAETGEEMLILAVDPETVRIQDVLDALKGPSRAEPAPAGEPGTEDAAVDRAFEHFRAERDAVRGNRTLRDLAQGETIA